MLRHFQICWLLLLNTLLNQVPVTLLYGSQHMPRLKQGYHYLCSHTRSYTYNHFDFNDPNNVLAGGRCVTESKCIMFVMLLSFSSFSVTTIYMYIYICFLRFSVGNSQKNATCCCYYYSKTLKPQFPSHTYVKWMMIYDLAHWINSTVLLLWNTCTDMTTSGSRLKKSAS